MTVDTPIVSVIVAMYNMEEFIAETLQSILASTYPHIEVLVMDDGSTDGSVQVVKAIAEKDTRVCLLHQTNQGVCHARNNAIRCARGEYILPVDADDLLLPGFIGEAVQVLQGDVQVKAVVPQGEYFGDRQGLWKLPAYNLHLLARKNMLPITALYRRDDWERVGGYCADIIAREDWEFWINVLKDGGTVVKTADIGLKYRVREGSKRKSDRKLFHHVVNTLNSRHPEFFERELGGPLRYHRTWSSLINKLVRLLCPRKTVTARGSEALTYYVKALPQIFRSGWGELIHDRRNQLRIITLRGEQYVVKSFAVPNIINRFVYGFLRPSKAQRSYEYALLLRSWGIGSPQPIAWQTERRGPLFSHSYYVSRRSTLPYSYVDIMERRFSDEDEARYLVAIAQTTARLHEHDCLHSDYSRGNILFGKQADGTVAVELIDLNRLRFRKVTVQQGCANLAERLPMTMRQRGLVAKAYAEARGANPSTCLQWLIQYDKT